VLPAYKEKNIKRLVDRLLSQQLPNNFCLRKIIIIATGYKKFPNVKEKKSNFD